MAKIRFLFASDFHGNETVWRKFLNSASMFKVDMLLMGGDLTGKVLIPIVDRGDGFYESDFLDQKHVVPKSEVEEFRKKVKSYCYIPYVCSKAEFEELNTAGPDRIEKVFENLEVQTMKEWCDLIPERVTKNVKVVIHPGNDDKFAIDEVLKAHPSVTFAEETVLDVDGEHEFLCFGWSNPTPWNSPRECPEEELMEKLERVVAKVHDFETAVFCIHVPPYDSEIDRAPLLDKDFRPVMQGGRPVYIPVGSKSVRTVIEKHQPLLGLHGHIHEAPGFLKIGRTQCLNPGSEYSEGLLKAFLLEIDGKKILRMQRVEG